MTKGKDDKGRSASSALKVNKGIPQPSSLNQRAADSYRLRRRTVLTPEAYVEGIVAGDRVMLSRAITLIESSLESHYEAAQKVIEHCISHSGNSLRVGITGVPGAGKSTFIEAMGNHLIDKGHRIAVLAVDPSSEISKGSILGDKTRMETLAVNENAFVRPSPSAGSLGGVARKTREIIILCEAAGYDVVFVETVGVGQSEIAVHSMVDFFLLLMISGAGDELQGIKRGIIEMCDGMVINKADGDNINKARAARSQYENALHLFPPPPTGWTPRVKTCSSLTHEGIPEVWEMIRAYEKMTKEKGYFQEKRNRQQQYRLHESINESLRSHFYNNPVIREKITETEKLLDTEQMTSFQAAKVLLDAYFGPGQHPDNNTDV